MTKSKQKVIGYCVADKYHHKSCSIDGEMCVVLVFAKRPYIKCLDCGKKTTTPKSDIDGWIRALAYIAKRRRRRI